MSGFPQGGKEVWGNKLPSSLEAALSIFGNIYPSYGGSAECCQRGPSDVWPMMMTEAGRTALVTGRKLIISSAAMCWSESPRSLMCVYSKITWEPHHRPVNSIRISRLVSILLRNGCTMQPKLQNTKSIAPLILETWTQNIQLGP